MADLKPEDFARLVTLSIPSPVTALAFSNDGTLLAVAAADKVHIFQVPQKRSETGRRDGVMG
jgi:hypothetical protein